MTTRRQFLKMTTVAGVGLAAAAGGVEFLVHKAAGLAAMPSSPSLKPFVDPLPIPAVARATGKVDGAAFYEITMSQFTQKLHRDLSPTLVWGYNGTYPGPTVVAQVNQPITVKYINKLPEKHLLQASIDQTIMPPHLPDVRAVGHLHGGHVPPESDHTK